MKKLIIGCVLSAVAITATAQTCNPTIQITRPDSRYEIMTNGTEVKDTVTGLIWQRCSVGQHWDGSTCSGTATRHNWQDALKQASGLGNRYRLPNIKELQSLVETACYSPAINDTIFPDMRSSSYWSASPDASNSGNVWYVYFGYGTADNDGKGVKIFVRGVRDGQ